MTLTNVSTGKSFQHERQGSSAEQTSAEWIAEATYSGGVLLLADFNSGYSFGLDYTGQTSCCFATIGGHNRTDRITGSQLKMPTRSAMDTSGETVKAMPLPLSTDGKSFSIAWGMNLELLSHFRQSGRRSCC